MEWPTDDSRRLAIARAAAALVVGALCVHLIVLASHDGMDDAMPAHGTITMLSCVAVLVGPIALTARRERLVRRVATLVVAPAACTPLVQRPRPRGKPPPPSFCLLMVDRR